MGASGRGQRDPRDSGDALAVTGFDIRRQTQSPERPRSGLFRMPGMFMLEAV